VNVVQRIGHRVKQSHKMRTIKVVGLNAFQRRKQQRSVVKQDIDRLHNNTERRSIKDATATYTQTREGAPQASARRSTARTDRTSCAQTSQTRRPLYQTDSLAIVISTRNKINRSRFTCQRRQHRQPVLAVQRKASALETKQTIKERAYLCCRNVDLHVNK
jgi:hypothetical protein